MTIPSPPAVFTAGPDWAEIINTILELLSVPSDGIRLSHYEGADPTGLTDSTAAFVAAHADAVAVSKPLIIDGHYLVTPVAGGFAVPWAGGTIRYVGLGWMFSSIKVANGSGNFYGVFGSSSPGTFTNIEISGVMFDLNNRGNTLANAAALTGNPRVAFYVPGGGHRVVVHHCRFFDADNTNTIVSGASNTWVTDCLFDDTGGSFYHDHSSIYVHGEQITITGNDFRAKAASGIGALTAIETHGSQQTVADNHAKNYGILANITGVHENGTIGASVHDNTAVGCAIGVILWSWTYLGSTTGLRGCKVHDNTIEIDINRWHAHVAQKVGILFEAASDKPFEDIGIHHNTVRYKDFTATLDAEDEGDNGIRMLSLAGSGLVNRNVHIDHNTIINPPAAGIYFNPGANVVADFSLCDNTVVNAGKGAGSAFNAAFKVGAMLVGTMRDVVVARNRVIDDQGTHTLTHGIDLQFLSASSVNVRAVDNSVRLADGVNIVEVIGSLNVATFLRHQASKFTAPTGLFKAGSTILDLATGNAYTQGTKPQGSAWSVDGDGAWVPATLASGWANTETGWREARYRQEGRRLFVEGLVTNTSGAPSTATFFTLPIGLRPPEAVIATSYLSPIHVLANGVVAPNAPVAAGANVGLAISFSLD